LLTKITAEHLNLHGKAEEVTNSIRAKADEFHIAQKFHAVTSLAASKLDAVDEKLHVKQKAGVVVDKVTNTAEKLKSKALENDVIRKSYDFVFGLVTKGANAVQEVANDTQSMLRSRQQSTETDATLHVTETPIATSPQPQQDLSEI